MDVLFDNTLVLLFTLLVLGALLGRLKIRGIELSASGGVLFVALAFGHWGYALPDLIGTFGFAFFIYAIGFGAGPRFFQMFRQNGMRFGLIAVFVAVVSSLVAVLCVNLFDLPIILLPGILAGALTSTSTLAAAYELTREPLMSVGYGITYPFGLIGLLVLIQVVPRWLRVNLRREAEDKGIRDSEEEEPSRFTDEFEKRIFRVQNPGVCRIPLRKLRLRQLAGVGIVWVRRGERVFHANADTELEPYDHVLAEGKRSDLLELESYMGPEVVDEQVQDQHDVTRRVSVSQAFAHNRTPRQLGLAKDFNVVLTRLQRGGIDMPVTPDMKLERGDVVTLTGPEERMHLAVSLLGREERKIYETDMFTFSTGLLVGVLLGMVKIPILSASLGNAGGLLFSGILFGYLRNFGPFSGRVPIAARYILQELGLLLFLATVGSQAGEGLVKHLAESGLPIFITGACITIITLISTLAFCRYGIGFDWNTSFGATTGGVTSTVALKVVTEEANSQYPVLGYAGVYAFATILLTILGQVLVLLS